MTRIMKIMSWRPFQSVCRLRFNIRMSGERSGGATGDFIIILSCLFACLFYSSVFALDYEFDEWGQPVSENEKYKILIIKLSTVIESSKGEAAVMAGLSSGISISRNSIFNIGLTIEKYSNAMFTPVYVGLRSCAPDISRVKAYLFIEAGYALGFVRGVSGSGQGGPFGAGGGGLGIKISDATLLSLELGFKYQHHQHHDFEDRQEIIAALAFSKFKRGSR